MQKTAAQIQQLEQTAAQLGTNRQAALEAMMQLGCIYAEGRPESPIDDAKALNWWVKAAQENVPEAFLNLSVLLGRLSAGTPDIQKKIGYCEQVAVFFNEKIIADLGLLEIPLHMGIMFEDAALRAKELKQPPSVLHHLNSGAARCYQLAMDMPGSVSVQSQHILLNSLARLYLEGSGVAANEPKAAQMYLLAATQGFGEAQFNLAILHYHGRGVEKSLEKTEQWLNKAVQNIPIDTPLGEEALKALRQTRMERQNSVTLKSYFHLDMTKAFRPAPRISLFALPKRVIN